MSFVNAASPVNFTHTAGNTIITGNLSANDVTLSETEISDNASPELKEIRRKKRHFENKIREQLDSMIHSSHYSKVLRDGIITQRNGRFVGNCRSTC